MLMVFRDVTCIFVDMYQRFCQPVFIFSVLKVEATRFSTKLHGITFRKTTIQVLGAVMTCYLRIGLNAASNLNIHDAVTLHSYTKVK